MPREALTQKIDNYSRDQRIGDLPAETGLAGLTTVCARRPSAIRAMVYEPSVCLILQGSKETIIGEDRMTLSAGQSVVVSHMVPCVSQIVQATPAKPYVALVFELDLTLLRSLVDEVPPVPDRGGRGVRIGSIDTALLDAMARLFDLVEKPDEQTVMAPLIAREIHFRLLLGDSGLGLRRLLDRGSAASRISLAIAQLKEQFTESIVVADLAHAAGMSLSTFHTHFKSVTAKTPLQFQKELRLMEARRLLSAGGHNVSMAAFEVGYESPTQFSREYARKFGVSPKVDRRPMGLDIR